MLKSRVVAIKKTIIIIIIVIKLSTSYDLQTSLPSYSDQFIKAGSNKHSAYFIMRQTLTCMLGILVINDITTLLKLLQTEKMVSMLL